MRVYFLFSEWPGLALRKLQCNCNCVCVGRGGGPANPVGLFRGGLEDWRPAGQNQYMVHGGGGALVVRVL